MGGAGHKKYDTARLKVAHPNLEEGEVDDDMREC